MEQSLQNLQANQAAAQQHMESNFKPSPILFNSYSDASTHESSSARLLHRIPHQDFTPDTLIDLREYRVPIITPRAGGGNAAGQAGYESVGTGLAPGGDGLLRTSPTSGPLVDLMRELDLRAS
jgi:hypothetical protein